MKKHLPFSDQLRAAVLKADVSRYKISKATGVAQGNLSNFVHGKAGLSLAHVDKLCDYLQLRLVGPTKKGK